MKTALCLLVAVSLSPSTAVAQSSSWHDYVVPESGAVAQIPVVTRISNTFASR